MRLRQVRLLIAGAVGIGLVPAAGISPAAAAPLAYQESVSGDLPDSVAPPILQLDVGVNTVSGSQFFDALQPPPSGDFDSFRFVVPQWDRLTGLAYTTSNLNPTGNLPLSGLYVDTFVDTDTPPNYVTKAHETVKVLDPAHPVAGSFASGLPLGAGTYLLYEGQLGGLYWGQRADWDYTWTLTVAAPEPASAAVLGMGLAGVAGLRWRRSRRPGLPR